MAMLEREIESCVCNNIIIGGSVLVQLKYTTLLVTMVRMVVDAKLF